MVLCLIFKLEGKLARNDPLADEWILIHYCSEVSGHALAWLKDPMTLFKAVLKEFYQVRYCVGFLHISNSNGYVSDDAPEKMLTLPGIEPITLAFEASSLSVELSATHITNIVEMGPIPIQSIM